MRVYRTTPAGGVDVSVIDDLATELAKLPGIGRKTASRLTYHLLNIRLSRAAGWRLPCWPCPTACGRASAAST